MSEPRGFTERHDEHYRRMMEHYANHVIRSHRGEPGLQSWMVGSADASSWYHFRVTEHPGGIVVTGDTVAGAGECIAKPLGWWLGTDEWQPTGDYLGEKSSLVQAFRRELFVDWCIEYCKLSPADAVAEGVAETEEEHAERCECVREARRFAGDDDTHAAPDALPDSESEEPPGWDYRYTDIANLRAMGDTLRRLLAADALIAGALGVES